MHALKGLRSFGGHLRALFAFDPNGAPRSTLERHVEALGGKLEIHLVVDDAYINSPPE